MWRTEFAEDGLRGVVITERSVHVTVDGGRTWTEPELLNRRDVSVIGHGVAFGDEGSFMVSLGYGSDSLFLSQDADVWYQANELEIPLGFIYEFVLSPDGTRAVIGVEGSGLVVGNDVDDMESNAWTTVYPFGAASDSAASAQRETVRLVIFRENVPSVLIGTANSVMVSDDGMTWEAPPVLVSATGRNTMAEFATDGMHGVVGIRDGSVVVTANAGERWVPLTELELDESEWIVDAVLGRNGPVVLVGSGGAAYALVDDTWQETDLSEGGAPQLRDVSLMTGNNIVGIDRRGRVFLLRAYPELPMELGEEPPGRIVEAVQELPAGSVLRAEIEGFVGENTVREGQGAEEASGPLGFTARGAALLRREVFALFMGLFARGCVSPVLSSGGQQPSQHVPASFRRPAEPRNGTEYRRSVPLGRAPFWTFARRSGTVPWAGGQTCDGCDDRIPGT